MVSPDFVTKPGNAKQLAFKVWEVVHCTKEKLRSIAQANYSTARQYDSRRLELVRYKFYEELKNQARFKKNETV